MNKSDLLLNPEQRIQALSDWGKTVGHIDLGLYEEAPREWIGAIANAASLHTAKVIRDEMTVAFFTGNSYKTRTQNLRQLRDNLDALIKELDGNITS